MRTIWKYELKPDMKLMVPEVHLTMTVQLQNGIPHLWIFVDPNSTLVERKFNTYGTGHDVPDAPGYYIGTFQMAEGQLVFHVFESE